MNRIAKHPEWLMVLATIAVLGLCVLQISWLSKAWSSKKESLHHSLDELARQAAIRLDMEAPFSSRKYLDQEGRLIPDIAEITQALRTTKEEAGFEGKVHVALFQAKSDGVFLSDSPTFEADLRQSSHRVCLSCIMTLRFAADTAKAQHPEMTFIRSVSEYTALPDSPAEDELVFLSLYMPKLQQSAWAATAPFLVLTLLLTGVVLLVFGMTARSFRFLSTLHRLQKDFFTNMTHEFKTPLSSIGLAARMLNQNESSPQKQSYLRLIQDESANLGHQVDKILHFAQVDQHAVEYDQQNLNLQDLIDQTLTRLRLLIESREAHIQIQAVPEDLQLVGSKNHLGNCLYNLLENALKYSEQPPVIFVSAIQREGWCYLTIRDRGMGIPPEHRPHIFNRYYRVQEKDTYAGKGFGIGLSYTRSVIEAHGGTIRIDPAYKEGASFIIQLPVHA